MNTVASEGAVLKKQRLLLLASTLIVFALALGFGSTDEISREVIYDIRLPRVILAFAVGAGLSLAGMILQAVFSNPLCEPYTLGISSGATLGSVIASSAGLMLAVGGFSLPALIGAVAFAFILDRIASRSATTQITLLLSGVMLGFVGSSLVALWMAIMDSAGIQAALVWLLGDLSRARPAGAWVTLGMISVATLLTWHERHRMDALLLGETNARSAGVDFTRTRRKLIFLSSFVIAVCVSGSGMIGFIGLLVPHLSRRLGSALHGRSIPMGFWMGGVTLVLADLLARVLFRPYELPVGVITSLIGAPVFVWVLFQKTRRHG